MVGRHPTRWLGEPFLGGVNSGFKFSCFMAKIEQTSHWGVPTQPPPPSQSRVPKNLCWKSWSNFSVAGKPFVSMWAVDHEGAPFTPVAVEGKIPDDAIMYDDPVFVWRHWSVGQTGPSAKVFVLSVEKPGSFTRIQLHDLRKVFHNISCCNFFYVFLCYVMPCHSCHYDMAECNQTEF